MSFVGKSGVYTGMVAAIERLRQRVRRFHFARLGLRMGREVIFYGPVSITWPDNVELGDNCSLNRGVHLGGRGGIRICNRCRLSANAFLETGYLEAKPGGGHKRRHAHQPITLGENVWVGAGATVLAGVHIGDHAVVAAGAVVCKDVPAEHIAKGVPAVCTPLPDS
jgi:acetyltransferase-like isoleucine patch superfamily enzyme